jgi:hypothetical protein
MQETTSGNYYLSEKHLMPPRYYLMFPYQLDSTIPARDGICVNKVSGPIVASWITYVSSGPDSGADAALSHMQIIINRPQY